MTIFEVRTNIAETESDGIFVSRECLSLVSLSGCFAPLAPDQEPKILLAISWRKKTLPVGTNKEVLYEPIGN